jgi:predicted DCC family thiol-disulfide oxidoreductase YuxK
VNVAGETLVFFDGACPLCSAEMRSLRRWDRRQRLMLIDISAPDFDASVWPVTLAEMNAALHVRLPDGTWARGMAATRAVYRAIGRGWMVAFTGWPAISHVCDAAYAWFARRRRRFFAGFGTARCDAGVCDLKAR